MSSFWLRSVTIISNYMARGQRFCGEKKNTLIHQILTKHRKSKSTSDVTFYDNYRTLDLYHTDTIPGSLIFLIKFNVILYDDVILSFTTVLSCRLLLYVLLSTLHNTTFLIFWFHMVWYGTVLQK